MEQHNMLSHPREMSVPWKSWTSLHQWMHFSLEVIAWPNPSYRMLQRHPFPVAPNHNPFHKKVEITWNCIAHNIAWCYRSVSQHDFRCTQFLNEQNPTNACTRIGQKSTLQISQIRTMKTMEQSSTCFSNKKNCETEPIINLAGHHQTLLSADPHKN